MSGDIGMELPTEHPDNQVLIPYGSTPTGFGLFWSGEYAMVRAMSPCCGGFQEDHLCICAACGTSWKEVVETKGATTWLNFNIAGNENLTWVRWVQNLTGWENVRILRH